MIIINAAPSYDAVVYDLYGNFFAKAPTYVNSALDLYGAKLIQPGYDGKMYAFGGGSSGIPYVNTYNPPVGTGSGSWTSITGVSQWAPGRNLAAIICLPNTVITGTGAGCTGI